MVFGFDLSFLWVAFVSALPLIFAGGSVVGLIWYFTKHPDSKYAYAYPIVVAAVKMVEKNIADDTQNSTLAKIDAFAKEFDRFYTENQGKEPSDAVKAFAMRAKETVLMELMKAGTK